MLHASRRPAALMRALALLSLVLALFGQALPAAAAQGDPPGYFSETGYAIGDAKFYDYFNARGGIRTFGYPVSRVFTLDGFKVQIFQRRVLQLNNGNVTQLNLLDAQFLPYTKFNGATVPAQDDALVKSAPPPSDAAGVLAFVKTNTPNAVGAAPTGFYDAFTSSVTMAEAYPNGGGNQGLLSGIWLEMWGVPTSRPAADPNNANFIFQRFQRGIMHYDAATKTTQGLLLGDYFKSVLTGQNLPADLADQAKASRYLRVYDNSQATGLKAGANMAGSDLKNAFEKEAAHATPGISASAQGQPAAPPPQQQPASTADTSGFRYGIQAHLYDVGGGERNRVWSAVKDLGLGVVKQQIEWKAAEPSKGAIAWGQMDVITQEASANGLGVLFSVKGSPAWARESGFNVNVDGPPQDPQNLANFVGAIAGRYCGKGLAAIEVWNEQNLNYEWGNLNMDPAAYVRLLTPSYRSIKAACPAMIVVSGALTPAGDVTIGGQRLAVDDFTYLTGMYRAGVKDVSDAIGVHPSGYNVPPSLYHTQACDFLRAKNASFHGPCDVTHHSWSFRSTIDGYAQIMADNGDGGKKLWATEFGWAAGGAFNPAYGYANDNSFAEQANWTVEAYQYMKNSGRVGAAFLWNLNFRPLADRTEKAQWGIVTNLWQPLPAYNAIKAMGK